MKGIILGGWLPISPDNVTISALPTAGEMADSAAARGRYLHRRRPNPVSIDFNME
jgi:hypothetical protein